MSISPEEYEQVREVFDRAKSLAPEESERLLADALADEQLRDLARSLIRGNADSDGFLETAALPTMRSVHDLQLAEGDTIQERYRIVRLLGEGGMGAVYLAEQDKPIKRSVALKVIKIGMDTKRVMARFEQERQALALMDHPNIARVLDAGATESGRPFFVMEYVEGEPLTHFCNGRRLAVRQRLGLLLQVCAAVQHAHQKGIIHRDLKPSNILVNEIDGQPAVKVIDFGIAKATEQGDGLGTLMTEHGQMLGTPAYMSPEQAIGDIQRIDSRTDIYSLGVVLYELLTGSVPLDEFSSDTVSLIEMQRVVRDVDPRKPSTRLTRTEPSTKPDFGGAAEHRKIRGDLDWITMKALEKEPSRRYPSASALAADIERHLACEPVIAGPPSTVYRMSKFVRRNRTAALGAAAVFLVLIIGVVGTSVQAVRATRAERVAVEQRNIAEDERARAEEEATEAARQASIAQAVADFLNDDVLAAADPRNLGRDVTVLDALDAASESIEDQFEEDPVVEASVQLTIGWTFWELGQQDEAEPHLLRALELRREHLGEDHGDTLQAMNRVAGLRRSQGQYDEAESLYREITERRRVLLGNEDPLTLTGLTNLAGLYREQGRTEEARPLYEEAEETASRIMTTDDAQRLSITEGLAGLYKDLSQFEQASELYEQVLETRRATLDPEHPLVLMTMNNLAVAYRNMNRPELAEPLMREAYEKQKVALTERHRVTLATMTNLARLLAQLKKYDEAAPLYARTLELSREVLGEHHRGVYFTAIGYAQLLMDMERFEEAADMAQQCIDVADNAFGSASTFSVSSREMLAAVLLAAGKAAEAEPIASEAAVMAIDAFPAEHPFIAQAQYTWASALIETGNADQAEVVLLDAFDRVDPIILGWEATHHRVAMKLAEMYAARGDVTQEERWRERAAESADAVDAGES